ncbi:MAG TPA: tyrosine-type recombinase/integrase [Kofleriaceae bacterium]|jgi:integrase|nr:tyrosine-type recombinase/integrase [Kofleriaceae bacterium]
MTIVLEDAGRRRLRVPAVLRESLAACVKDRDGAAYLFPNADGGAHWRDWVRKNVKRICGLAKVPKVTAHAMRGLLATIAYEQGVVGDVVAAHLGHEEQRTSATAYAAPGAVDAGARARGQAMLEKRPN